MQTLSQQMAAFITADINKQLTPEIYQTVQLAFLDTAGCILSGRDEPVTRVFGSWINQRYLNVKEASLFFSGQKHSTVTAAMLNAVSGHALDFDDVALAGHPSVVLVPALWAESERSGMKGKAIVSAYVKGYEVWADILNRLPDPMHEKGFHPTAVLGTMAVTAALCAARQLSPEQTAHALGMAASRASGLVANFGSMSKPLHAGWAVEYGYSAVELAQLGATASADALEGATGFLTALADKQPPERKQAFNATGEFTINTVKPSVKKYPVCYASHRIIDGVLALRQKHDLPLERIQTIHACMSETTARVLKYPQPSTPLEAKFSLQFACAAALIHGEVSLPVLTDETLKNPLLHRLMQKVTVSTINRPCPLEPSFAFEDEVSIMLDNGQLFDSGPIRFALGHAQLPLMPEQIESKILSCVYPHEQEQTRTLIANINQLFSQNAA
ncbi:MAG: MmgE/PrpD family protein [Alcaligenaceae bacterium]|nr:MmgE/PrpD family protein [Alcaligenaceae bacterium]